MAGGSRGHSAAKGAAEQIDGVLTGTVAGDQLIEFQRLQPIYGLVQPLRFDPD